MINNPYPGKFISIDGIDGSGKSTQINFMKKYFSDKGYQIFSGHEPTGGEFGDTVHDILFGRLAMPEDPLEFQKLYVKDRKEHLLSDVIPSLKKENSIYIADRYFLSTLAYGMAGGVSFDDLVSIHEEILGSDFIVPDIMFVINVNVSLSMKRLDKLKGDAGMDIFEKRRDFLERVSEKFLSLKEKFDSIHIVNGNETIESVSKEIKDILNKKFI
jgi:dTMP kinase